MIALSNSFCKGDLSRKSAKSSLSPKQMKCKKLEYLCVFKLHCHKRFAVFTSQLVDKQTLVLDSKNKEKHSLYSKKTFLSKFEFCQELKPIYIKIVWIFLKYTLKLESVHQLVQVSILSHSVCYQSSCKKTLVLVLNDNKAVQPYWSSRYSNDVALHHAPQWRDAVI